MCWCPFSFSWQVNDILHLHAGCWGRHSCHGALTTSRCAGFPIGTAVALSNVGVFGGGMGNFILNVRRRHPKEDKPLIDW